MGVKVFQLALETGRQRAVFGFQQVFQLSEAFKCAHDVLLIAGLMDGG
jgi:hypothetical protein